MQAQHGTFQVLGEPVIQELWRLLKKERDTLEPGHSFTVAPYKGLAGMSGLLFHPESPVHRGDTAPPPHLLTLFLPCGVSQLQRMDVCVGRGLGLSS